jgi:hypothetical protein
MSIRTIGLIAFIIFAIAAVFLLSDPIAQDPNYHAFSDARNLFGVQNFWNVVSNLPFLLVGAAGLIYVHRYSERVCVPGLETTYSVFFVGILLTAFGSSYYHLAPANQTLVWDRLPMTIGFAGLITIIVGEFLSARVARSLLVPLLLVGFLSVEYWDWTETRGIGDLRPYAIVQFLPMLLIPIVLLTHKPAIGEARYYWWMIAFYFLAKVFEFFDASIFGIGQIMSGHAIKHIAAAMTPAVFLYALSKRR